MILGRNRKRLYKRQAAYRNCFFPLGNGIPAPYKWMVCGLCAVYTISLPALLAKRHSAFTWLAGIQEEGSREFRDVSGLARLF